MNIEQYCRIDASTLSFTPQQASDFAKKVAGDFNPIHDPESKRFCVPGDLLFSVILHHYGLYQKMDFNFSGMVGNGIDLVLPDFDGGALQITDQKDKAYLTVECSGNSSHNRKLIDSLATHYVEFSSKAFPHILVPLMEQQNVMINPDRPLVIYDSMSFELDTLDIDDIHLELSGQQLEVNGKRGDITLQYTIHNNGDIIGRGCKRMVLSGLREFDKPRMDELVDTYNLRKQAFNG